MAKLCLRVIKQLRPRTTQEYKEPVKLKKALNIHGYNNCFKLRSRTIEVQFSVRVQKLKKIGTNTSKFQNNICTLAATILVTFEDISNILDFI